MKKSVLWMSLIGLFLFVNPLNAQSIVTDLQTNYTQKWDSIYQHITFEDTFLFDRAYSVFPFEKFIEDTITGQEAYVYEYIRNHSHRVEDKASIDFCSAFRENSLSEISSHSIDISLITDQIAHFSTDSIQRGIPFELGPDSLPILRQGHSVDEAIDVSDIFLFQMDKYHVYHQPRKNITINLSPDNIHFLQADNYDLAWKVGELGAFVSLKQTTNNSIQFTLPDSQTSYIPISIQWKKQGGCSCSC